MFEDLIDTTEEKLEVPDFSGLIEGAVDNISPTNSPMHNFSSHLDFDELPEDMQQKLSFNYFTSGYNFVARTTIANIEHRNRIEEHEHRAKLADYVAERADDRRLAKETETMDCFVGADGCIWAEIRNPLKKDPRTFCVIDCRGLKLTKLVSVTPSGKKVSAFWLCWDAKQEGIYLLDKDFSEEILPGKLQRAGITLKTTRRNHKPIIGKLIALLRSDISEAELPFGFGWHRNLAGEWHFINQDEKTYTEVVENVS